MKRPKHIRIYDNGGKTFDRYTVVYMDEPYYRPHHPHYLTTFNSLGMNSEPFHPQGFAKHSAAMPGSHLGKRIKWEQLPQQCQQAVIQDTTPNKP